MTERKAKNLTGADPLEAALADWRACDSAPERLSGPVRERILEAIPAKEGIFERPEGLTPVFFPLRRFVLAAAVPALVLVMALGYVLRPGTPVETVMQVHSSTQLQVSRQGDDVVFRIANGTRTHRVYKSSEINGLASAQPVLVSDGVYRDKVEADTNLVFYRID